MSEEVVIFTDSSSEKEHMLIAIMANTAQSLPYTQYIVWTQVLPQYFDQQYARSFAYQFLIALSTNFIGYGLAGLTRRFIGEYPNSQPVFHFCVLPVVALADCMYPSLPIILRLASLTRDDCTQLGAPQ
jgi:hypothetical protein